MGHRRRPPNTCSTPSALLLHATVALANVSRKKKSHDAAAEGRRRAEEGRRDPVSSSPWASSRRTKSNRSVHRQERPDRQDVVDKEWDRPRERRRDKTCGEPSNLGWWGRSKFTSTSAESLPQLTAWRSIKWTRRDAIVASISCARRPEIDAVVVICFRGSGRSVRARNSDARHRSQRGTCATSFRKRFLSEPKPNNGTRACLRCPALPPAQGPPPGTPPERSDRTSVAFRVVAPRPVERPAQEQQNRRPTAEGIRNARERRRRRIETGRLLSRHQVLVESILRTVTCMMRVLHPRFRLRALPCSSAPRPSRRAVEGLAHMVRRSVKKANLNCGKQNRRTQTIYNRSDTNCLCNLVTAL
jgi:hypothetical protein